MIDSVCELFGETIRNVFECGCSFAAECYGFIQQQNKVNSLRANPEKKNKSLHSISGIKMPKDRGKWCGIERN